MPVVLQVVEVHIPVAVDVAEVGIRDVGTEADNVVGGAGVGNAAAARLPPPFPEDIQSHNMPVVARS